MKSNRRQFIAASAMGAVGVLGQRFATAQGAQPAAGTYHQVGSIRWYCELRGHSPTVVLIPSGEGDCGSFEKVATLLSSSFQVLTFDMPGFSRSSDPPDFDNYSIGQAAREVAALVHSLDLGPAAFYGCSSGGQVALRLAVEHSSLVRAAIVHEVAPAAWMSLPRGVTLPQSGLAGLADDEIVRVCKILFRGMNENGAPWDALGHEYHRRLERNYITRVRRYLKISDMRMPMPENLRRRSITWTIGGLTEAASFFNNVVAAQAAGIQIGLLMCRHFPQVSIPETLAEHIAKASGG